MRHVKKITTRARILLIVIPVALLGSLFAIGMMLVNDMIRENSMALARQQGVELRAEFQRELNAYMDLKRQTARSYTVARWLADTSHELNQERAFRNIAAYHSFHPNTYLMFTSYETSEVYVFSEDMLNIQSLDERSNIGGIVTMDIQTLVPIEDSVMWLNHGVYFHDEFVGVVSVGVDYYAFINGVMGDLEAGYTRAHLIQDLTVHADSGAEGVVLLGRTPLEALFCAGMIENLTAYSQMLQASGGIFTEANAAAGEAFMVGMGDYRYGSIAPIEGTPWVIVILSNGSGVFGSENVRPLILLGAGILVGTLFLSGWLLERSILTPLFKLAQSIENISEVQAQGGQDQEKGTLIYGMDRTDEIGYLAKTISNMRENMEYTSLRMKEVQIIEESNVAKSKFLARMSHEIRTPISAILGVSEVQLKKEQLPESVEEAFAKIYTSGGVLLNIINDILDLSRIESGRVEVADEAYQLTSLIGDVMQRHLVANSKRDLAFELEIDETLPAQLSGDVIRIEQIINNIVSNAFKYTLDGEIKVSFNRLAKDNPQTIGLQVLVEDTGFGMSQEQIDKIFHEYVRFSEKEYRSIDGTGLGMSIVQNLCKLMNATIDISSRVGKGTRVEIIIPQGVVGTEVLGFEGADNLEQFKQQRYSNGTVPEFEIEPMPYGRVLVVDDLDINLYVVEELLSMYRIGVVDSVLSGSEAIGKIKTGNHYDIIFMDHMMPGMDGVETLKIIRAMGYKKPVIALTANAMIGQEEEFLSKGFNEFISKPIQSKRFNDVLHRYIKGTRSEEELKEVKKVYGDTVGQYPLYAFGKDPEIQRKLKMEFKKTQTNAVSVIREHLAQGDIKMAHIAIHSLKGAAGLIERGRLATLAGQVEQKIRNGEHPTDRELDQLADRLKDITDIIVRELFEEKGKVAEVGPKRVMDIVKTKRLLKDLKGLLDENSLASMDYIEELKAIDGTARLIEQIEDFEFSEAKETLKILRERFKGDE